MIFWQVVETLAGVTIVVAVLVSAIKTVVLPRPGFTRITQATFAVMHRLLVNRVGRQQVRSAREDLYGPATLVALPLVWMVTVTVGFALIFWGTGIGSWDKAVEVSGSSLFTLGFAEPAGNGRIWLSFVEATIGLGLVALLISFLPTIYSGYNEREKGSTFIGPFAGSPPSPVRFLTQAHQVNALSAPTLWNTMANWLIDLELSHSSFPALCYFPMRRDTSSWVADAGILLEAAALLVSGRGQLTDDIRGPVLALVYGIPAINDTGRSAGLPLGPTIPLTELLARTGSEPEIAVGRPEYESAMATLVAAGLLEAPDPDRAWSAYARIRFGYDRALRGLAGLTQAPPYPMTTDQPAAVGRPALRVNRSLTVDWSLPMGVGSAGPPASSAGPVL